jgi:hypothetical protein
MSSNLLLESPVDVEARGASTTSAHSRSRVTYRVLTIVGIVLLGLSVIGALKQRYGAVLGQADKHQVYDADLARRTRSFQALLDIGGARLASPTVRTAADSARALFDIVSSRFIQGEARQTLLSNWIMASAGLIHPAFRHIYRLDNLLASPGTAMCDQTSYVLVRLALAERIRARHVGMNGHVVAELFYDRDWHMFDPDYVAFVTDSVGKVLSSEDIARNPRVGTVAYARRGATVPPFNLAELSYATFPQGSRWEWKANLLATAEQVSDYAKYIIPLVLLLWAAPKLRREPRVAKPRRSWAGQSP